MFWAILVSSQSLSTSFILVFLSCLIEGRGQAGFHLNQLGEKINTIKQSWFSQYHSNVHISTENEWFSGSLESKIVSEITIICFDTQVYPEQVITFDSSFEEIKFQGGGGTFIQPVLNAMLMLFSPETIHVVFTDLEFDHTPVKNMKANLNIFWVTQSENKMPKGTMIKI